MENVGEVHIFLSEQSFRSMLTRYRLDGCVVFPCLEIENAIRESFKAKGVDTSDRGVGAFDAKMVAPSPDAMKMPMGAIRLNLQELRR